VIQPMVCVMLDNAPDARLKELTPDEQFITMIRDELLPWVHERYSLSDKPAQAFIGGSSLGGLAAAWVALKCPDLFGNVISQSGSYWWFPAATRGGKRCRCRTRLVDSSICRGGSPAAEVLYGHWASGEPRLVAGCQSSRIESSHAGCASC
ncbi:MAG TPA: alpha/beta hydrolase-fold protein, partial [Phototrophicaceae bacterium]|nr:alpha/beta hydrolase-fold protein [Phototrophicaceae bacterium]